ncbi:MAG: Uncharacterized protein CC_3748, partial [uncultured Sphingomonadaceae bacterium]
AQSAPSPPPCPRCRRPGARRLRRGRRPAARRPRGVADDHHRREQLSVARGAGDPVFRSRGAGGQLRRRDRHRLVRQPGRARRARQGHRDHPRPRPARRRAACGSVAPGVAGRPVGGGPRRGGHRAEAGGNYPYPRPRPAPQRDRRL